jgi:hypothetical protein
VQEHGGTVKVLSRAEETRLKFEQSASRREYQARWAREKRAASEPNARNRPALRRASTPRQARRKAGFVVQVRDSSYRARAVLSGLGRSRELSTLDIPNQRNPACTRGTRPTERRRSRTDPAWGYQTSTVLKTAWGTGPLPLREQR